MTKRVNDISIPSIELRADALVAVDRGDPYCDWAQLFPCLNELQVMDVESNHAIEDSIRIGSWNLERGKEWQRAADLIERENIEVLFLSEMDLGMSRSGQQHTAKELAARLGWHGLFAVEFVELELGNPWEIASPVEGTNVAGLHGNAILSRYPLHKPWLHRFTQMTEAGGIGDLMNQDWGVELQWVLRSKPPLDQLRYSRPILKIIKDQ